MKAKSALLLVLFVIPLAGYAQAYKCRAPSGKLEFSDSPCSGGAQTERVQSSEYISLERQRQARDVQARNAAQIQEIEVENASFKQLQQRQQALQAQEDARHRDQQSNENIRRQQAECTDLASQKNMARSQRAALAELCAKPEPNKDKFDDCKSQLARVTTPSQRAMIASNCTGDPDAGARVREASRPLPVPEPEPPKPISVIKSCNGATCTDQMGQRYTTQAGKTVRSDGKRCYQQGNAMYCN